MAAPRSSPFIIHAYGCRDKKQSSLVKKRIWICWIICCGGGGWVSEGEVKEVGRREMCNSF